MPIWAIVVLVVVGFLAIVAIRDMTQRKHAILRNFPLIGHLRYWLESIGPELRQYIVTDNEEERPFSRDQRRWVYSTAKQQNPYFGFGSDNTIDRAGYLVVKHAAFPLPPENGLDNSHDVPMASAKVLGESHGRKHAFRPRSIVNISAMSFGSLSGPAIQALNEGAAHSGILHNTGEGGISKYHRHGGELIFQMGTGYFGCRDADGFSLDRLVDTVASAPVRAIEVKLSQGAKPGLGGVLPGAKVTAEIAAARDVPVGETVVSPNHHAEFCDIDSMIDFIERVADVTGLPVGIKSAVGEQSFWHTLAKRMAARVEGPDFITVDGGEGGTGAGPLVFTDHVALPLRHGLARVYGAFVGHDLQRDVTFVGAGRLGFPAEALAALSLGADLVNVGREAMLAIGCVQAQRCHTGHCPTGVATQSRWLARGLDPTSKGARMANYAMGLRYDLDRLARACGAPHPSLVDPCAIELLDDPRTTTLLVEQFGLDPDINRFHARDIEFLRTSH